VKVQELLLKDRSLQHARLVFKMNANVVVTAMRTRTLLMVFKGELVTLQIHLLTEAIKVNVQGNFLSKGSVKGGCKRFSLIVRSGDILLTNVGRCIQLFVHSLISSWIRILARMEEEIPSST
jgi:hypothetical protein